ncbi:MAG TPA: DUF6585 family protein [Ktedonobacteraceae bacterium]
MRERIEQYAQAKSLGAFEQSYLESCSLAKAWGYTLLFSIFIVVCSVALFTLPLDQLLKAWPLLLFSLVWFYICGSVIVSAWQSYRNTEWIYLYNYGFIYAEKDEYQAYHWSEINAITIQYNFSLNGKNQSTLRLYQIKLASGPTLSVVKGTALKAHFDRYQDALFGTEQSEVGPQKQSPNLQG